MKNVILIGVVLLLFVGLTPIPAGASQKAPGDTQVSQVESLKEFIQKEKKELKALFKKKRPQKRSKTGLIINGFAQASLICACGSVLMILLSLIGIPFLSVLWILGAIAAIVLGIIGLVQIRRYYDEFTGEKLAIAGIVIGSISLVLPFLVLVLLLALFF
jgi:hypothetical protein